LNNYINILSKHTAKLTKEQLKAYSSWFFGTEDKALAPRATTADMVACMANLDAPGNQGLVATCKIQLCRKSAMLYHFLVNLLKTTKMMGPRGAHCTASTSTAGRLRDGYCSQI